MNFYENFTTMNDLDCSYREEFSLSCSIIQKLLEKQKFQIELPSSAGHVTRFCADDASLYVVTWQDGSKEAFECVEKQCQTITEQDIDKYVTNWTIQHSSACRSDATIDILTPNARLPSKKLCVICCADNWSEIFAKDNSNWILFMSGPINDIERVLQSRANKIAAAI